MKMKFLLLMGVLLPLGLYAQNVSEGNESRRQLFGTGEKSSTGTTQSSAKKMSNKELSTYLQGAVPMKEGRVVFSTEIPTQMSKSEMIKVIREWASKRFVPETGTPSTEATDAKVLSVDSVNGKIVCVGDEYLVFTRKFLVLNQARVHYIFTIQCKDGSCALTLSKISYDYNPTPEENTYTRIPAENQITDEYALRSGGTKLVRGTGTHFRVFTIDLKNYLFSSVKRLVE